MLTSATRECNTRSRLVGGEGAYNYYLGEWSLPDGSKDQEKLMDLGFLPVGGPSCTTTYYYVPGCTE
jgi:hypothetical protein